MQSLPQTRAVLGSHVGAGAGDHDQPYRFGRSPRSNAPYPFSTRQFAHLLMVRSLIQAGLFGADDLSVSSLQP